MSLKESIEAFATLRGADIVGVARPRVYVSYLEQVRERLEETGAHGEDYMLPTDAESFFEVLSDPRHTLASAKSIVVLGVYAYDRQCDYGHTRQRLEGRIARTYSYYPVVRQVAEHVSAYIRQAGYMAVHGQQVPLKHIASEIGLGSYGWNGLCYTKDHGSYVALRAIITDAELAPDTFTLPSMVCDTCGRCIEACPTGALYAPYKVNPKLCINPLSRRSDDIPEHLRTRMSNWLCGCDICQQACPINKKLVPRIPDPRLGFDSKHHASHRGLSGLTRTPDLAMLLAQSDDPVLIRNAIIALGNIGGERALSLLRSARTRALGDGLSGYVESAIRRMIARASDAAQRATLLD